MISLHSINPGELDFLSIHLCKKDNVLTVYKIDIDMVPTFESLWIPCHKILTVTKPLFSIGWKVIKVCIKPFSFSFFNSYPFYFFLIYFVEL